MKTIESIQEFETILAGNDAVLAYFSTENCSVCKVLKPKIVSMISEKYPRIEMVYVESDKLMELAAQYSVFTAPTIIVFLAGYEAIRKSRAFGVDELKTELARPYSFIFS